MKKIVIIGAGLAGTILATKLSKYNRVYLLDIGDFKSSYPMFEQNSTKLASVPTFSFGYGGTSKLWHNGLIDIKSAHVKDKTFTELLGKIDKYTEESISILSNGKIKIDDLSGSKKYPFDNMDTIIYPKERYQPKLHENITFIENIRNVDFEVYDGNVVSIKYNSSKGESKILIDSVVISCGGLNSNHYVNKLLDRAGDVSESNDHPMGFVGKITVKRKYKKIFNTIALQEYEKFEAKQCFTFIDRETDLRGAVYFRNAFTKKHSFNISKHKSKLGASGGFFSQLKHSLSFKTLHPDIILEVLKHLIGFKIKTRTFSLMFVGEQSSFPLKIKKASNNKKIQIEWDVTSNELNAYNRMLRKFLIDNAKFIESYSVVKIKREDLWSAAHYSGAVALGSAVDIQLKVKGYNNAYVCDGSVISNHSYANTGLVISKLCCYLAEEVLA